MSYRIVALTVSTALFVQYLDTTALTVALPAIARDLGVSAIDLNVAILAYQLSMTVLVPVGAAISDRLGQRNAFVLALIVFIVGAVCSAMSTSLNTLIAARALQGASGAILTPVSRLLVVRSADKSQLIDAMNWLLVPSIVGPMLGPVIAGQIVTYYSWHWIFLINVPVALLGVVLTMFVIPDIRDKAEGPIDWKGLMMIGPAICALMLGLERAVHPDGLLRTFVLISAALAMFCLYLRHSRRTPSPVLDLSLLRIVSFRQSLVWGSAYRTFILASGFIIPLWLQLAMGMSAAHAGLIILASSAGMVGSRLVGGQLTRIMHPHTMAITGSVAYVGALAATSLLDPDWPLPAFYAVLGFQAVVVSLAGMVVGAVAYVDIPPGRMAQAASLFTTVQQLTISFGITLGVWSITGMRLFYGTGEQDGRVYSASMMIVAVLSLAGIYGVVKLDARSVDQLHRPRQARRA